MPLRPGNTRDTRSTFAARVGPDRMSEQKNKDRSELRQFLIFKTYAGDRWAPCNERGARHGTTELPPHSGIQNSNRSWGLVS
jgi:hypothetical protein